MGKASSNFTEEKSSLLSFIKNNYLPQLLFMIILLLCVLWAWDHFRNTDAYAAMQKLKNKEIELLTKSRSRFMSEADEKDKKLQKAIKQIETSKKAPEDNYYIRAASATDAAEQIKKDLNAGKETVKPIMQTKGDYTLVQPLDDKQMVNIYRVNKDNPRMIGFNVSNTSKSIVIGYDRILLSYGQQNGTKKKIYGATYLIRW